MFFALPELPSELLLLALHDLEACEKEPDKYRISMVDWYFKTNDWGVCSVCLAGAIIAQHLDNLDDLGCLKSVPNRDLRFILPSNFRNDVRQKLNAINELRNGQLAEALITLGIEEEPEDVPVVDYSDDPTLFKQQMRDIVKTLQELGY